MNLELNITVGVSSGHGWLSKVIGWFARGPSHAWFAWDCPSLGMRVVAGAGERGFIIEPWESWSKKNTIHAEFKPIGPSLSDSLKNIAKQLGDKYDYWAAGLVGIKNRIPVLHMLWRHWIRGKLVSRRKLMCSEALVRFLGYHNLYQCVAGLDPESTGPRLLLERWSSSKDEMEPVYGG